MPPSVPPRAVPQSIGDEPAQPMPGEQPAQQDAPAIDDAPVAPLTTPEDTEGG
jgi:hypothetical protein